MGFGENGVDFMIKIDEDTGLLTYPVVQLHNPPELTAAGKKILGNHVDVFFN